MEVQIRVDEHKKTPQQIAQREATYEAAKVLRRAGFKVDVREWFTGKSTDADAASIVLDLNAFG